MEIFFSSFSTIQTSFFSIFFLFLKIPNFYYSEKILQLSSKVFLSLKMSQIKETTIRLLEAKKAKGYSFADLGQKIGRDEVWVASLFYHQARADENEAKALLDALDLPHDLLPSLTDFPLKGLTPVVPTDPLIYRFYEILQVYGMPLKAVIHEKFGDGIMSAIDFTCHVEKEDDPNGKRVKVIMNGKFLPYKKW